MAGAARCRSQASMAGLGRPRGLWGETGVRRQRSLPGRGWVSGREGSAG